MGNRIISGIFLILLIVSMLSQGFLVQDVQAADIIIDTDGDSRFTRYPSGPYWWWVHDHDTFRTRAYNGNFWYTYSGADGTGEPLCFGTWYQSLSQSDVYEVFVWIPNPDPFGTYTPTQSARYQIYHKDGMTLRTVNQGSRTGGWYSVGTYTFDTSLYVILNDRTGEPYMSTMIAFDAVKFVPIPPPTYAVHLESRQDTGSTSNLGTITFDSVPYGLPTDIAKEAKTYSISYTAAGGYEFYRWETSGGVSVASSTSPSTTATVNGAGTLRAVYKRPITADFSISASPPSLTIQRGNSGSSTITITSINGFNQLVQLTVSGAPSGVTATLSPLQVTPPAGGTVTSTLTVSVTTTATLGSYTSIVTGTSGTLSHNTQISLEITAVPPPENRPPILSNGYVTPSSGDTSAVFNYYVTYKDPDGDAPTIKYVYIDGSPYTMTRVSGGYTSGAIFKYSRTLPEGSHNYYFDFDDGHSHPVRLPVSGTYPGPSVSSPPKNQKPDPPDKGYLFQYRADHQHEIPEGGRINEDTVSLFGVVSDPDGDRVKLQIELRQLDEGSFIGIHTHESEFVDSDHGVIIDIPDLAPGDYHWQARTVDEEGLYSDWVGFGYNLEQACDFTITLRVRIVPSEGWGDMELFVPVWYNIPETSGEIMLGVKNRRDMWYLIKVYKKMPDETWSEMIPDEFCETGPYIGPWSEKTFVYVPQTGDEIKIEVWNDMNDGPLTALYLLDLVTRFLTGIRIPPKLPEYASWENFKNKLSSFYNDVLQPVAKNLGEIALEEGILVMCKAILKAPELYSSILVDLGFAPSFGAGIITTMRKLVEGVFRLFTFFVNWPTWRELWDNLEKAPFMEEVVLAEESALVDYAELEVWVGLTIVQSEPYYVGETIKVRFAIANRG